MKKIISFLVVFLLIPLFVFAAEDVNEVKDSLYDEEFNKIIEEDIYEDIGDVKLLGNAGLAPGSFFYFVENMVESVLVGDNPKTALAYKEEKILELQKMVDEGNAEGAQVVLKRVKKYNEIIQKEVSPDIEKQVRESSKAVKDILESFENEIDGEEWENVQDEISENLKIEDKIALAAKVSTKIKELCQTLSDLDPLEYSSVCKTDDDAPEWKKELDKELTEEQEKEAKEFFKIMSECFTNPSECKCEDISIIPFAEKCSVIAPLAAECEVGNEDACEKMESVGDPVDLLPDYLQGVLKKVENSYGDAKHDLHIPGECVKEGALSREACMKVMFKINAPPECLDALEDGRIDPKNEREAKDACDEILFDLEAPEECKEAGLRDHRECERYLFKLDAPQDCLDAGLTGVNRDDWKKCDAIRFKLDAPQECLDAGFDGSGRDDWKKCDAIKFQLDSPPECLDAGLDGSGRDDWKKCDAIRFKLDAPQECLDAGLDGSGRDDWKKCDVIRFKFEAHPDCLAAGLDGLGRHDWDECSKIQFKADAPKECLDAGLDGSGRRDWDECNKIREETEDSGSRREDCASNELHICDGGYCYCISKEDYDKKQGYGDDGRGDDNGGSDEDYEESECKDGCSDECPDADRTDCVDDGMRCECYYDNNDNSDDGDHADSDDSNEEPESLDQEEESHDSDESSNSDESSEEEDNSDSDESESDDSGNDDNGGSDDSGGEITGDIVSSEIPEDNFLRDLLHKIFY